MKNSIKIVIVMVTVFFSYTVFSQEDNEVNIWSSMGLEYQFNKNWEFGLSAHLRLKDNSKTIDNYFPEFTVSRKLYKNFKLGLGFRYIRNNDTEGKIQGFENHFRFHTDLSYKHKISNFTLNFRIRYQNKNELGVSTTDGDYAINRIRFKLSSKYDIKNWPLDPELAFELFNKFGENINTKFDKYRIRFRTSYNIKHIGKIKLFYQLEQNSLRNNGTKTNVIGLKYTYSF